MRSALVLSHNIFNLFTGIGLVWSPRRNRIPVLTYAINLLLSFLMTIRCRTARYVFLLAIFALILQTPLVTGQSRKSGVTVSYETSGRARIARFKNSNPYQVRAELSDT